MLFGGFSLSADMPELRRLHVYTWDLLVMSFITGSRADPEPCLLESIYSSYWSCGFPPPPPHLSQRASVNLFH